MNISVKKSSRDHRKQELIDATMSVISEFGLSNTTVSKVTQKAGLSAGIVNFYFESKERLLLGTLENLVEEYELLMMESFNQTDSPQTIIHNVIELSFSEAILTVEKASVWYAFDAERRSRNDYLIVCGEIEETIFENLLQQVEKLCRESNKNGFNANAITRALQGLVDSHWQEMLFRPEIFNRQEAKNSCLDYMKALFPEDFISHSNTETLSSPEPTKELSDLLPPWTYQNKSFLDLEKIELFKKNWLMVGHISDIPEPRNYLTFDAVGERALIVRGKDNEIKAFHNVCRHRGSKLIETSKGTCPNALICPFHGWSYHLDGSLLNIPAHTTFENLEKDKIRLVDLDLEIWNGFIFIRFISGGKSLAESMKPVDDIVAPYLMESLQPITAHYEDLKPYNWKVIHDIDNEGYHVPVGHPSLQQLYGQGYSDHNIDGVSVAYGKFNEKPGKSWSVSKYKNLLPNFDHLPEENQKQWIYVSVFPNLVFGLYPESVEFYMTIPVNTDETRMISGNYALPDDRREVKVAQYLCQRINRTTTDEDESFVKGMQEGLNSSALPEVNLSSLEEGVRRFHKQIQSILPIANQANEPEEKELKSS